MTNGLLKKDFVDVKKIFSALSGANIVSVCVDTTHALIYPLRPVTRNNSTSKNYRQNMVNFSFLTIFGIFLHLEQSF